MQRNYESEGNPFVRSFFDERTNTFTHVVSDRETKKAAVIDSVTDFDAASGRIFYESADAVIAYVNDENLDVVYILETHAHADHLSGAPYVKKHVGGKIGIGKNIQQVQRHFRGVLDQAPIKDEAEFDVYLSEGDALELGSLTISIIDTPGHTPADITFEIGDALFVGDVLFAPDYGTARCDFPGGSTESMYDSVQKLYAYPDAYRIFLCHDYLPKGRDYFVSETTVGEQKKHNILLNADTTKEEFILTRNARDAQLTAPHLLYPSLQVNIEAGNLPVEDASGKSFMKIPITKDE